MTEADLKNGLPPVRPANIKGPTDQLILPTCVTQAELADGVWVNEKPSYQPSVVCDEALKSCDPQFSKRCGAKNLPWDFINRVPYLTGRRTTYAWGGGHGGTC